MTALEAVFTISSTKAHIDAGARRFPFSSVPSLYVVELKSPQAPDTLDTCKTYHLPSCRELYCLSFGSGDRS